MRESRTYGSVRGAPSDGRPYRDRGQSHGFSLAEAKSGNRRGVVRVGDVLAP